MARYHKDIPSLDYPEVAVHQTWSTHDDKSAITIRGYAIDTSTGSRKHYAKVHKLIAQNPQDVAVKQIHLYNLICKEIVQNEKKDEPQKREAGQSTALYTAFQKLVDSHEILCTEWSSSSAHNALTYFERNVLPRLDPKIYDWSDDNRDELQRQLTEDILSSHKSLGREDFAKSRAIRILSEAHIIYHRIRDFDSSLPDINLKAPSMGRISKTEQIKSLPSSVRQNFVQQIEILIESNPRLALAIIIMYDCGLRTAEAAAVWHDQLIERDTVTSIFVSFQLKHNSRTKILKSANGYRYIPLTTWGQIMANRCLESLPKNAEYQLCETRILSSTIKRLLVSAGLSENVFAQIGKNLRKKTIYDHSEEITHDICAYILRRDWSSRAKNICGFTPMELDYCLGHKVIGPKTKIAEMRTPSAQQKLKMKMERCVHNPLYSNHPKHSPLCLQHNDDIELIPYDTIRLKNISSEPLNVALDISTLVNGEPIVLNTPPGSEQKSHARHIPLHKSSVDIFIIGSDEDTTSKEDSFEITK